MWNTIKKWLVVLMIAAQAGCGNNDGFGLSSSSTTGVSSVAALTLLVSSPQLGSSGGTSVVITAIAKDENNNLLPDIAVAFTADSGALAVTSGTTDASGQASATLSPGGDYTNRAIALTATAGSITSSSTVNVVGTNLAVSGEAQMTLGDSTTLTYLLSDSDANAIANKTITFTSALGNTLSASTVTTDSAGQVQITITATTAGADTITATSQGASVDHALTVSADQFEFTTPAAGADVNLNTNQTVTVRWRVSGVAQVGQTINFSATRGTLSANSAVTDANGDATVTISSTNAGPSTITAYVSSGPSTSKAINFVATTAATIELQVSPATIGPNDGSQATPQQSTISATVRDANNNLVKGKVVRFSITQDSSAGSLTNSTATTDSLGKASTTYVSSAATTAKDGVVIKGDVQGTAVTSTVSLTVAKSELFVKLGTGNKIELIGDTIYNKKYSVVVTDASGNAVEGAVVDISITPVDYRKGFYTWIDPWVQTITATCPSEDLNNNGILDAGEDDAVGTGNNNGTLEPGIVVSTPPSVTTGADGTYEFDVKYPREYAYWTQVSLTATRVVSGTEASHTVTLILPGSGTDYGSVTVEPPGLYSPFGVAADCTDPS